MAFSKQFLNYQEVVVDSLTAIITKQNIRYAPSIADNKLIELEELHNIKLPKDYRRFLLTIGNGGAEDDLLPIEEAIQYERITRHNNIYMLILTNYVDIYIGLAIAGPDYGTIWSIHHHCCFPLSANFNKTLKELRISEMNDKNLVTYLDKHQSKIPRLNFEYWYSRWILVRY